MYKVHNQWEGEESSHQRHGDVFIVGDQEARNLWYAQSRGESARGAVQRVINQFE